MRNVWTMEQSLAEDSGGGDQVGPLLECRSCKGMRVRSLPRPYVQGARAASMRGTPRSHNMFWRPWLLSSSRKDGKVLPDAYSLCENNHLAQKHTEYSHPVRLFWPKSKSISHMYREANDLLRNFPVQATISFYNDSESDTDNEDDQSEEELDSGFESA
ncbi:protein ripply2 [Pelobates fuscus]|uniref:protein ripply2 n=1 Tax=Pelobates fuscus TaxID=191477 RepID=UPI002FE4CA32